MSLDPQDYIRSMTLIERKVLAESGAGLDDTTIQIASCATIRNPLAGTAPTASLDPLVDLSVAVGELLVGSAMERAGGRAIRGYGKAALVGTDGDLEHGAAMIHVRLGLPMRRGAGGGPALIPGNGKVGPAGTNVDVIFGGLDDAWDYDAMDTMSVVVPDSPRPNEILLVVGYLIGTRPGARISGASQEQVRNIVADIRGES